MQSKSVRSVQCECGATFQVVGTSGRFRCDECGLARKREQALEKYYRKRDAAGLPKRGDILTTTCEYCPTIFKYVLAGRPRTVCDECIRRKSGQTRAAWVTANPESIAANKRRYRDNNSLKLADVQQQRRYKRYKVTPDWERETMAAQGGKCGNPACGATAPGGRFETWNIDHDHLTGIARGLLCSRCNKGVGQFDDSIDKLLGMAQYIEAHRLRSAS